jgi:hypothetical protein
LSKFGASGTFTAGTIFLGLYTLGPALRIQEFSLCPHS